MGRQPTPMDRGVAGRIAAAAERDPDSRTARSGFPERAADAAERNEQAEEDGDC